MRSGIGSLAAARRARSPESATRTRQWDSSNSPRMTRLSGWSSTIRTIWEGSIIELAQQVQGIGIGETLDGGRQSIDRLVAQLCGERRAQFGEAAARGHVVVRQQLPELGDGARCAALGRGPAGRRG